MIKNFFFMHPNDDELLSYRGGKSLMLEEPYFCKTSWQVVLSGFAYHLL